MRRVVRGRIVEGGMSGAREHVPVPKMESELELKRRRRRTARSGPIRTSVGPAPGPGLDGFGERAVSSADKAARRVGQSCQSSSSREWSTHGTWKGEMDGAHKRQRMTADVVVGDKDEAAAKRQRVQRGVAASGRPGQALQVRAASGGAIPEEVRSEVAKAMQAGSALVQASIEHLETAERSWDDWVAEHGVVIPICVAPSK